ncbi:hypothetical protein R3P38DRAFT_3467580 [Favolaschia claudopus]|uniref:Uncharacterized protein n=1 Tax=Favolaschia claudopus TaxID=2862362 RepID=A0AAW0CKJ9_9AGAR
METERRAQRQAHEQVWISKGLPSLAERQTIFQLIEDWAEIHSYTLAQARAWAFREAVPPLDFRSEYFHFHVKYRPEENGNPSTSFTIEGATICRIEDNPASSSLLVHLKMVEIDVVKLNGTVRCLCILFQDVIDGLEMIWYTACDMNVGTSAEILKPGLMKKEGNKWVWREYTPQELAAETGITL